MWLPSVHSENYFDWRNEKQKAYGEQFATIMEHVVCTYHTDNTVFSSQNYFRIYKYVSEEQFTVLKNFPVQKKIQFRKNLQSLQKFVSNFEKQGHIVLVNIVCNFDLWVRFPSTHVHMG